MTALTAALLDTDVFSALFVRTRGEPVEAADWRSRLTGRQVVISFQTRAELLYGAKNKDWGQARRAQLEQILDRTVTIQPDLDVIDAFASLRDECRRAGHALHDRPHTADRWIAACAIAKDLPLLAADQIYRNAPGLQLL